LTWLQVSDQAGVAPESFYESFANENDCIEFACEHSRRHLFDPVKAAYEEPGPWLERLRAIGAHLDAAVEEPLLAELCLIHSLAIGNEGRAISIALRSGDDAGR
jgi:AcrR family transcriptional regulator